MKQPLINITTGKEMQQGKLECDWQEFVLGRLEEIKEDMDDIESQFLSYNCGFLDGIRLALTLDISRMMTRRGIKS